MLNVQRATLSESLCPICKRKKTLSHNCCPQKLWKHGRLAMQMTQMQVNPNKQVLPKRRASTAESSSRGQLRTDSSLHVEQPNPPPPEWLGSDPKVHFVGNHINELDNGFHDWEHMKIKGRIRFKQLLVLMDSGCTHNFISSKVVQVLGLKTVKRSEPYVVHLPDGSNQLWTNRVENVPLRIQTYQDLLSFGVMELPHIDIILGQEWLFSKDPIISFRHHTVELQHNGSLHKLVGEKGLSNFPIVTLDDDQPTPR